VSYEVERDLERKVATEHVASAQTARIDVESYVPPVVSEGRTLEPNLAHDLGVAVERLFCILSLLQW
jgi:hypothetical protein